MKSAHRTASFAEEGGNCLLELIIFTDGLLDETGPLARFGRDVDSGRVVRENVFAITCGFDAIPNIVQDARRISRISGLREPPETLEDRPSFSR